MDGKGNGRGMTKSDFCVISTNCISGFWYRDIVKTNYEVPFIWTNMYLSDLLALIKEFDTLDLKNIKVEFTDDKFMKKDGLKRVKVVIENKVQVFFVHHSQSRIKIDKPIVSGISVVCPDVIQYVTDAWLRRVEILPYNKKRVWVTWDDARISDVDLNEFVDLARERIDEIFVIFISPYRDRNEIGELPENAMVLPITNYGDVPKHTVDLEKALEKFILSQP